MLATALALMPLSRAADWYLKLNQPSTDSWNILADWNSASDAAGNAPASLLSSDNKTFGRRYEIISFHWPTPADL